MAKCWLGAYIARATVPVFANNRDQCLAVRHVLVARALVPVCGNNRDRCPGYMRPPASTLLKKFQDCVWGGVGARIFSLIAYQVFDEMSKPHLGPQNTVSSAEVSNLIFSICN